MKKLFILAAAALMFTACSKDSEVVPSQEKNDNTAIGFQVLNKNMSRAKEMEKAGHYNFGVFAYKNVASPAVPTIMENYLVGYHGTNKGYQMANADQTTLAESLWAYEKLGFDDYTYDGTEGFYTKDQTFFMSNVQHQFLRYWDYSTDWTNFYGYAPYINGSSTVTFNNSEHKMIFAAGTIKDGVDDPSKFEYLYVAQNVSSGNYGTEVPLKFMHLNSKIRITFWEDIAGYKVNMINLLDSPVTIGVSAAPAKEGTPEYTYGDLAKTAGATLAFSGATFTDYPTIASSNYTMTTKYTGVSDKLNPSFKNNQYLTFKTPTATALATTKAEAVANPETNLNYSNTVYYGIPKDNNCGLTFHVSFVLTNEATDETITVKNARVYVPGTNCAWEAGKQYTYVFKITKDVTGTTGDPGTIIPGDPNPGTKALYPIIFDGITIEDWATATEYDHNIN